jgi:RNA polymerase sigma-70 factor (ECF subfamily)
MTMGPRTPDQSVAAAGAGELVGLLARVARRDSTAFARLYKLTEAKLYGVIVRILRRDDASGEALQDAFVRIWERAGDFDPNKGSPLAWMATIARNRALDEVRRARPVSLEDMPESFEPAAEEIDPLGARQSNEELGALIDCLKALDEEKRRMVLLAYYHGQSRDDLARRFDKPVPTVKTWLRRSLLQLRDCLGS